jgi:hypothetical protein
MGAEDELKWICTAVGVRVSIQVGRVTDTYI